METHSEPSSPSRVRFGAFELNLQTRELCTENRTITLADQPYKVLVLLLKGGADGVSREKIINELWSSDTAVDIEHGINAVVKSLRRALNDSPDEPNYIKTLPKRGYKLLVTPEWLGGAATAKPRSRWRRIAAPVLLLMLVLGGLLFYHSRRAKRLTDKDIIVLSDFTNTTGDAVFDDALRQGLSAQLEQSPFLQLLSDERIAQALALMSQPKNARLTPDLTREICQRTQSAVTIEGSIVRLGTQYVVGLRAVSCRTGDLLAEEQAVAPDREHVLKALGHAATDLRTRLGESLTSVQTYDVPLESVTTSSLEALKAYSLGKRELNDENYATAIALGERASGLDPDFAMAYMLQGLSYSGLNENERATENINTAYKLRDRVSQHEKFIIESAYIEDVPRDLAAARKKYELWAHVYPHDSAAPNQLGNIYLGMGDYDEAVAAFEKSVELDPEGAVGYINIGNAYLFLNRPNEAEAEIRTAQARHFDSTANHVILYVAAFLRHDAPLMDREKSKLMGQSGYEDQVLNFESDGAAYEGHLTRARELSEQAADSAERAEEKEVAASYIAESALRDSLVGNFWPAKRQAKAAVARSNGSEVEAMAAIAFALAGDFSETERLAADLNRRFPEDTIVQFNYLPVIRTAAALHGSASKALQAIGPAERYELGWVGNGADFNGYPVYFRGEALLANHQATLAMAEFQKILDHPGVVMNEPISVLAYLGLGRACALLGDRVKAEAAYKDFLTLWKDADPDIPVYRQAKVEYTALKSL